MATGKTTEIDLTSKKKLNHKLTNRDIQSVYDDIKFFVSLDDFRGAFACWVVRQFNAKDYLLIINAIKAYSEWLEKGMFKGKKIESIEMHYKKIEKLTSSKLFASIPEIYALNQVSGSGFVDLGALSRNVFFHILREEITQPL